MLTNFIAQAAALALEFRDAGLSGIVAQVLHFPSLCHPKFFPRRKYEFGSYVQNFNTSVLNAVRLEFFIDTYVPDPKPDQRHSPLLAESLKGLPPARKLLANLTHALPHNYVCETKTTRSILSHTMWWTRRPARRGNGIC